MKETAGAVNMHVRACTRCRGQVHLGIRNWEGCAVFRALWRAWREAFNERARE